MRCRAQADGCQKYGRSGKSNAEKHDWQSGQALVPLPRYLHTRGEKSGRAVGGTKPIRGSLISCVKQRRAAEVTNAVIGGLAHCYLAWKFACPCRSARGIFLGWAAFIAIRDSRLRVCHLRGARTRHLPYPDE
jgi:hypothetical protein